MQVVLVQLYESLACVFQHIEMKEIQHIKLRSVKFTLNEKYWPDYNRSHLDTFFFFSP